MPEHRPKVGGGTTEGTPAARQTDAACEEHARDRIPVTLEKVLCRENMWRAYQRVASNAGAPGMDGITVEELKAWLQAHWEALREELLDGTYQPSPVRKVGRAAESTYSTPSQVGMGAGMSWTWPGCSMSQRRSMAWSSCCVLWQCSM